MNAALRWVRHLAPGSGSPVARRWLWVLLAALLRGLAASPTLAADERPSRFVWDEVSVTVRLQDDGSMLVREHDTVQFTGGPFQRGYREIPLAAIADISRVTVAEVGRGPAQPYTFVPPSAYSRDAPRTYTFQRVGTIMRIQWSFPPTTSAQRAWVIAYVAQGALRVSDDAASPYQEISWIGVDSALTRTAPVNRATLTFILPRPVDPAATVATSNGAPFGGSNGQTWFWRAERLGAGDTLVASLRFPPLVQVSELAWRNTNRRLRPRAPRASPGRRAGGVAGVAGVVAASTHPANSPSGLVFQGQSCRE